MVAGSMTANRYGLQMATIGNMLMAWLPTLSMTMLSGQFVVQHTCPVQQMKFMLHCKSTDTLMT